MVRRGRTRDDAREIARNAALAGVRVEIAPDPDTEVWPDNWVPMRVIQAMATQWNVGMTGRLLGLRYEAMPFVLGALQVRRADRADVFQAVQVMEAEILKARSASNG